MVEEGNVRAMSGGGQNTDPQSMDYPKMDYTNVV